MTVFATADSVSRMRTGDSYTYLRKLCELMNTLRHEHFPYLSYYKFYYISNLGASFVRNTCRKSVSTCFVFTYECL